MNFQFKRLANHLEVNAVSRIAAAAFFILLFTLSVRALNTAPSAAPDFALGNPGPEVIIEILPGEAGGEIGEKLEEAGVVKSSLAFFRVAVSDERSIRIAPGSHLIQTRIPSKIALEQLLDSNRIPNLIKVREGARWTEINSQLRQFGLTQSSIETALKDFKAPKPFETSDIEGFIYPAQYSFNKNIDASKALQQMWEKFNWMTRGLNWSSNEQYAPYEILIMASLIQNEGTPDVFRKVSRVIYNRLELGMPLQFDSTVHYALNKRGNIRVSLAETKIKSSYNTYINRGLPPTPIGSPSVDAIKAALNPAEGDWIYFVTVKPQETRFTSSYEEFLDWKAEYKRNFNAGLFE